MLELRQEAEEKGTRFELTNITNMVRRVLEVSRLDSVFQITPAVEFVAAGSRNSRVPLAAYAA